MSPLLSQDLMNMSEQFCQFILDPPSQCGSYRTACDFDDPQYICCGAVARFQLCDDYDEWLCAEHYDLILACQKAADPVAYNYEMQ